MNFQTGDIVLIWGKGIEQKMLRWVIYLIFGIKNSPNHVQIAINEKQDISADGGGVHLVIREDSINKAKRIVIARHREITEEQKKKLINIAQQYIGKSYDYFLFILWYMRVSLLFVPIVWIILQPWYEWLKKREERSYSCSELVSELLDKIGFSCGIDDHTNAAPCDIYQIIKACNSWEIIFTK